MGLSLTQALKAEDCPPKLQGLRKLVISIILLVKISIYRRKKSATGQTAVILFDQFSNMCKKSQRKCSRIGNMVCLCVCVQACHVHMCESVCVCVCVCACMCVLDREGSWGVFASSSMDDCVSDLLQ